MTVNHDLSMRLDNICADMLESLTNAAMQGLRLDADVEYAIKFHLRRLATLRELLAHKEHDLHCAQQRLDDLLDISTSAAHPVPIKIAPVFHIKDFRS